MKLNPEQNTEYQRRARVYSSALGCKNEADLHFGISFFNDARDYVLECIEADPTLVSELFHSPKRQEMYTLREEQIKVETILATLSESEIVTIQDWVVSNIGVKNSEGVAVNRVNDRNQEAAKCFIRSINTIAWKFRTLADYKERTEDKLKNLYRELRSLASTVGDDDSYDPEDS